jgi:hypothetical protein
MSPLPIMSAEISQRLVEAAVIYTADASPDAQPPDAEALDDLLERLKVWHPTQEELDAEAADAELAASTVLPWAVEAPVRQSDEDNGLLLETGELGDEGDVQDGEVEATLAAVLEEAEGENRRRSNAAQTPTASTAGQSSSQKLSRGRLDATASERDPDEGASDVDEEYDPPAFVENLFNRDVLEDVGSLEVLVDPATLSHVIWTSVSEEEGMISDLATEED